MKYLTLLGCYLFMACQTPSKNIKPAFYHWQTDLALTTYEQDYLDSLNCQRLYIKFFDLDWQGKTVPLAILNNKMEDLSSLEIIPTIFITNRTFTNLREESLPDLVQKTYDKIFYLLGEMDNKQVPEIQFDCDWSGSTKEKYFQFLKLFKQKIQGQNIQLSATIRLHQIKYFEKTGVPPVDRGILMLYNVGKVEDIQTDNSILDLDLAKAYFYNFEDYPLELDVALPIFSWGVLYRNEKLIKLLNNLGERELSDSSRFVKIAPKRYKIIKSTYLQGYYLYEEDVIRIEDVPLPVLEATAEMLAPKLQSKDFFLTFYHLDSVTIKNYPHESINALLETFQ